MMVLMQIKPRNIHFFFNALAIGGLLWLSSCNNTKNIAAGDALYTGASVKMKNSPAPKKVNSVLTEDLEGLIRPKPNSKLLGIRLKLSIYNLAGKPNPKGRKGLGSIIRKFGEPPVLLSQVNIKKNEELLTNYLENRGFFHAVVTGDTLVKNTKAKATYTVEPGGQYKINNVTFPSDSSVISETIRSISDKTILKNGDAFNLDVIKGERTRIDITLKEKGFYFFSPDNLIIYVDSTIGSEMVNLYVSFKPGIPMADRQAYRINDVYIYSNYNLNTARRDTLKMDSILYKGYYVIDRKKTFKPQVFDRMMRFRPGDLYNRTDHNLSLSRLINLGTFKFVKNRFEVVPDSFKLNAFYYLTPLPKKSLSAELGGSSKSNNSTGSDITLRWKNRNALRGAEQLSVKAYVGTEVQISAQGSRYPVSRAGAEANLTFPRFIIPIVKLNTSGSYVPRTNIQLGYDVLNRQKLYTLNSFRTQFGYIWKESPQKEHNFNPIAINFVQPLNVTDEYQKRVDTMPLLKRAIEKQFTIGSNYVYNYNQLAASTIKNPGGIYLNTLLDLSGNIAGLITKPNLKNGDTARIFKVPFSQYIKTEVDFRYYFKIGQRNQWANRIIAGVGYPYGNSSQMPFIKQFFVGGNNSLRGFRSRSLGPGTYNALQNTTTTRTFFPDQTGDIKIELNSEYRAQISGIFYGAIFIDAGNVWLYNDDSRQLGGKFSKNFLKELASDAGVGIRFDLSILLLRLDVAFPISDPRRPAGDRLVIDQFGNKLFRRTNTVYNLAIGLPF